MYNLGGFPSLKYLDIITAIRVCPIRMDFFYGFALNIMLISKKSLEVRTNNSDYLQSEMILLFEII